MRAIRAVIDRTDATPEGPERTPGLPEPHDLDALIAEDDSPWLVAGHGNSGERGDVRDTLSLPTPERRRDRQRRPASGQPAPESRRKREKRRNATNRAPRADDSKPLPHAPAQLAKKGRAPRRTPSNRARATVVATALVLSAGGVALALVHRPESVTAVATMGTAPLSIDGAHLATERIARQAAAREARVKRQQARRLRLARQRREAARKRRNAARTRRRAAQEQTPRTQAPVFTAPPVVPIAPRATAPRTAPNTCNFPPC